MAWQLLSSKAVSFSFLNGRVNGVNFISVKDFENLTGFLYGKTGGALLRRLGALLALALRGELPFLMAVESNDGINEAGISKILGVSRPRTSAMVKKALKEGMVVLDPGKGISLTENGLSQLNARRNEVRRILSELLSPLDVEERRGGMALLRKMAEVHQDA